jgi:hypothetical protein
MSYKPGLLWICLGICFFSRSTATAQPKETPVFAGQPVGCSDSGSQSLYMASNKKLLPGYEKEILSVLFFFPELKNVPIEFRFRKSVSTLKTRPALFSLFMPRGHRKYIITVSNRTPPNLEAIRFDKLPQKARMGVLGHELSHVVDFNRKTIWQSFKTALGHFSTHYLDSLEFNTDKICIEHGLGDELEEWSRFIRTTLHVRFWRGVDFAGSKNANYERYMNPDTIEYYMQVLKKWPGSTTAIAR